MKAKPTATARSVKLLTITLSFVMASLVNPQPAKADPSNVVSRFFQNSERKIEAKDQCYVLKLALIDMITKTPDQLKQRRYVGEDGKTPRWTITQLLTKHYTTSASFNNISFYEDYRKKPAKSAIAKQIQSLGGCSSYGKAGPQDSLDVDFGKLSRTIESDL